MSFYLEKLNSILEKEISEAILREVEMPGLFITLSKVKTKSDLSESEVFISVFPKEKENEAMLLLKNSLFDIQKRINKRVKIKHIPKIVFKISEEKES